jgi:regulator of replication initiation timing
VRARRLAVWVRQSAHGNVAAAKTVVGRPTGHMDEKTSLHPLRFYGTERDVQKKLDQHVKTFGKIKKGVITYPVDFAIPEEYASSPDDVGGLFYKYIEHEELLREFCEFWIAGRQIFLFAPALIEELRQTEVGDVPWLTLRWPYDYFYVAFEKQNDISINIRDRRYCVDGAYCFVEQSFEKPLHIFLTTALADEINLPQSSERSIWKSRDPVYRFLLKTSLLSNGTVKEAYQNGVNDTRSYCRLTDDNLEKMTVEFVSARGVDCANWSLPVRAFEKRFERGLPLFQESLNLIVNCVCFLTQYNEHLTTRFTANTPKAWIEKSERANNEQDAERNARKMASQGFAKIHFCGTHFKSQRESDPTGRELPCHWRRGHWRKQPHGPALSQIKLIWIRPTLVRADKAPPERGRIYNVDEPEE